MQYRSYSQGCAAELGKYPGILAEVVQGGVCSLLALKGEGSIRDSWAIKNAWSFSHHKLAQPLYGIKARNIYLFSHTLGGSSTHTYPCKVLPGGNI